MSNRVKSELKGLSAAQKEQRMLLGLAIAEHYAKPGVPMTQDVLAAFCGCTDSRILQIEKEALAKLSRRFKAGGDRALAELADHFFFGGKR